MAEPAIDLGAPRRVHVVAVGGVAMNGIASILAAMGHTVSGCDASESPVLDRLRANGITAVTPHDPAHVADVDVVFASTAVRDDNPEIVEARRRGIPVLRRADAQIALAHRKKTVVVAGTHGKTTTTAMLVTILRHAGADPAFIVGGEVAGVGSGSAWGSGEWFVVEGDESDGTFLELPASLAVVTSVEPDHLGHYGGSVDALHDAFRRFLAAAPARLVCADDEGAAAAGKAVGASAYGTGDGVPFRVVDIEPAARHIDFTVVHAGADMCRVHLPMPGAYNALNATAAIVVARNLGVDPAVAAEALAGFGGVARRFQVRGERDGVTFVDDYAHLPSEVRAALRAAKDGGWGRVVCVFQPHRYTRTRDLWRDFATAFDDADLLVVTDLYTTGGWRGEDPIPGVSGKLVLDGVLDARPGRPAAWMPSREGLVRYLRDRLRPGDLCLTLGAGDLTTLPDRLLEAP